MFAASSPTAAAPDSEVRATLEEYAGDTWQSFVATGRARHRAAGRQHLAPTTHVRSAYTSPTNIGAYIWSTLVARDIGDHLGPTRRPSGSRRRCDTLATLERHEQSGQFYNWYDPATGEKLTDLAGGRPTVYPFLSSVDNGWLAAALMMVTNAVPRLRDEAQAHLDAMDFGFYYDPAAGLIRGGFWDEPPAGLLDPRTTTATAARTSTTPATTTARFNTEPRIASYIGIAEDQIPATHYFKMWRTFPRHLRLELAGDEARGRDPHLPRRGRVRGPLHLPRHEHRADVGRQHVRGADGAAVRPRGGVGPGSWGVNHPLYVQAQIEHGLEEADYGYWGFSPSNNPDGGYREYGVDPIGLEPNGYASDQERTLVDYGFGVLAGPARRRPPTTAGASSRRTPHSWPWTSPVTRRWTTSPTCAENFDAYGWGGFYDAIDVINGIESPLLPGARPGHDHGRAGQRAAQRPDAALLQPGQVQRAIRPLLAMEEFTAGPAGG